MLLIVKPALFVPFVSTDQNSKQNRTEFTKGKHARLSKIYICDFLLGNCRIKKEKYEIKDREDECQKT